MDLILCEKPKQGRAYAAALGANERANGALQGNGYIVTWCIGHIMEELLPVDYDKALKAWSFDTLPIVPKPFKLRVKPDRKEQYKVVATLLKRARRVFICTDPDREGEAIARNVLDSVNYAGEILRIFCSSNEPSDIKAAMLTPIPNEKSLRFFDAQKGRSRADWLVGMNFSRAVGLAFQKTQKLGKNQKLSFKTSVGRVQTPLLQMCALREKAIRNFKPKDYYHVSLTFGSSAGAFAAKLSLPEDVCNDNGGLDSLSDASDIISAFDGSTGSVTDYQDKISKSYAPLPFVPSVLYLYCEKLGLTTTDTKNALQSLYEAAFVTYPRTDNPYLPDSMLEKVDGIFSHLNQSAEYQPYLATCDTTKKAKCFKNVDAEDAAHHGIIPTVKAPNYSELTEAEKIVYDAISIRFIQQFMPPREFDVRSIKVDVNGFNAEVSSKSERKPGWCIDPQKFDDGKEVNALALPKVDVGDAVVCDGGEVITKTTTKPSRFTEATLLAEMGKAEKYLQNENLRDVLKKCGLGTEATQQGILEGELKKRTLVVKSNRIHLPADVERYVDSIPDEIKCVDTTATWEEMLVMIEEGELSLADFMTEIEAYVVEVVGRYTK